MPGQQSSAMAVRVIVIIRVARELAIRTPRRSLKERKSTPERTHAFLQFRRTVFWFMALLGVALTLCLLFTKNKVHTLFGIRTTRTHVLLTL